MPTARQAARPTGGGWAFRFLGFDISIPWNALIGIVVIAVLWYPEFTGSFSALGTWLLAATFGVLLTASVLVHELAHALSARAFGYHVTGVTLWAMGGYTTYRPSERHGPLREAAIAVAGPLATLLIAAVAWFIAAGMSPDSVIGSVFWAMAGANLLVGLFNLLPGSPLDGGAIVKSIVWGLTGSESRGQVVSAWIGRGLAILLAASPFLLAFALGGRPSIALIAIALILAFILWTGASTSLKSAEANAVLLKLPATELARPIISVSSEATLVQVPEHDTQAAYVVAISPDRKPLGVLNPAAAEAVPMEERPRVSVMAACVRITALAAVSAQSSAKDVLNACQEMESRYVVVLGEAGPIGLIDTDAVFVAEGS